MNVKYIVYPGAVKSIRDGDTHFVSARRLIALYEVDPRECIIYQKPSHGSLNINHKNLIALHPKTSGKYTIPTTKAAGVT